MVRSTFIVAFLAAVACSHTVSARVLEPGCHRGFVIKHAGPGKASVGGNGITNARGNPMREGMVAVHDLAALPYDTKVQIPSFYGQKVFSVQDYAIEENDRLLVIWHDDPKHADGRSTEMEICVVK